MAPCLHDHMEDVEEYTGTMCVDDTCMKLDSGCSQYHLNNLDQDIMFATEKEEGRGLFCLDKNTMRKADGSLKVTIYRKPTHTNQYFSFTFKHPLDHKLNALNTLLHRASSVITEGTDRAQEEEHVNTALRNYWNPKWA